MRNRQDADTLTVQSFQQDGIIGDISRDVRKGSVSVVEMQAGKME